MKGVLAQVGAKAATAPKGSPEQQVGTFYNAYMDTAARDAAGMTPLQPQLDAIAAIQSMDDLVRYLATSRATTSAPPALLLLRPDVGLNDSSRYVINAGAGTLRRALRRCPGRGARRPPRAGYQTYLTQVMQVAGYAPDEAARLAELAVSIEAALQPGKLTPVELAEPANRTTRPPLDALQAQIPELDLRLYLATLGLPETGDFLLSEPRYYPVLSRVLREHSLQDLKDYITVLTVTGYSSILSTGFDEPTRAWSEVLTGVPCPAFAGRTGTRAR